MMNILQVQLLRPGALLPTKANPEDAGFDLYALEDGAVPAKGWSLHDTGIAVTVPPGTYGRIAPRSGMSTLGICVGAGVVDRGYRGPIKVLLYNHAESPYAVRKGDRIAQLVLEKIEAAIVLQVERLENSSRGQGGFGSTGA